MSFIGKKERRVGGLQTQHANVIQENALERANEVCFLSLQVVWAESYAVGCGRTFCSSLVNYFPNTYIITCNYGPGGNIVGQDVYLPGPSCTECSTGIGECFNNLCRPCSDHSEPCECRAECHNCGTMNSDCSCTCRDGWRGPNCARECENTDIRCGNGWPTSWCGDSQFPFVDAACHLLCGYCNPADPDFICSPTTTPSTTTQLPQTTPEVTQAPTTTTQLPQTTPEVTQAPTTTTPTTQTATAAAQSPMTTRMPTTEASSTPSTVATTTEPPCTLTCLNGGRLDSRQCICNCLSQYQGSRCQNLKTQVRYGVELTIAADISIFPRIRDLLFALVSRLVTGVCNGDIFYPLCCPGGTGKDTDLTLNYVDSSHVSVADGYPEERPQYDPIEAFAVMLLITPPTPSDLCMENLALGRKRRDAQSHVIPRDKRQTDSSSEGYLSQGALYEAVSANIDTIASEVNVTVLEVTRGAVEEGEVLLELQYVLIIIIAIIVALAIVLAIITICWGRNTDSAKKNSGGKRKPHNLSSSQF
nr:uncharacterized protein LOC129279028 [Lytechinus pictus]